MMLAEQDKQKVRVKKKIGQQMTTNKEKRKSLGLVIHIFTKYLPYFTHMTMSPYGQA